MTENYPLATLLPCCGRPVTRDPLEDRIEPYQPRKAYYSGDMVNFDGNLYICVAPEGIPCRRSPVERPRDWEALDE